MPSTMTNSQLQWLQSLPSDKLTALHQTIEAKLALRKARNRIKGYAPYAKQRDFHSAGKLFRERLFTAGNQLGKTLAGGAESAVHLTGRYPDWWDGRVFEKPPRAWAASETAEVTRDGVQRILVGEPKDEANWGTGFIPHDALHDWGRRMGVKDALDYVTVRWGGGGDVTNYATLGFKSYDQGRTKFQVETLDFVWLDEEPDEEIYTEALTRTNATGGMLFMTFTPLKGLSKTVARFLMPESTDIAAKDRHVTRMTIDDAEHYTPEQRAQIIASYPEHEREARTLGIPTLGSGRVFPIAEAAIVIDPMKIDSSWPQINGMDFGFDHPFAAVNIAWDRDADVVYVTKTYRSAQTTPPIHASAIRPWGVWVPCAWPHDGYQHDKGSGDQLAQLYRDEGLRMLQEHATHDEGGYGVEAGITEMLVRMQTGRLKVFRTCGDWLEEFRIYHRKGGLIVKERDDLMSATRIAVMMLRKARTHSDHSKYRNSRGRPVRPGLGSGWGS